MDTSCLIDGVLAKYPERLVRDSEKIEGPICATIMKEITLIDDCGIEASDFLTVEGRFLFKLCAFLRNKDARVFDEITFRAMTSPEMIRYVDANMGGWAKLERMMAVVNLDNWDMVLERLKTRKAILLCYECGFNLFQEIEIRNPYNHKEKIKVVPIDYFEKNDLTSDEISSFYEGLNANIGVALNSSKVVEGGYVEFDDVWLNGLKDKIEVGVSFADAGVDVDGETVNLFPFMNNQICGLLPGTLNAWGAPSGVGKSTYMVSVIMALVSKGKNCIIVTNEMQIKQYKTYFLLFVLTRYFKYYGLTKKKLSSGAWTEEDQVQIDRAKALWEERFAKKIRIEVLPDANATDTCRIFKKWILRNGCDVFLIDTFKLSLDGLDSKDNTWVSIVKDTRDLAALAARYKVIGLMTVQLSLATTNRSFLDASCLSNCKAMKEVMTNLIMFRNLVPEELDPNSEYYIHPFRSKQNEDGEWYEEAFEPERDKTYRVAFIDKTRQGEDSKARGIAYLWKFDGNYSKFSETCKCRPTRKYLPGS